MTDDADPLFLTTPSLRDVAVPPSRWAVPAEHLPMLDAATWVTTRLGDQGWLVDELQVIGGPTTDDAGRESYPIVPHFENAAAVHRDGIDERGGVMVTPRWIPTTELWVYRDAAERLTVGDIKPAPSWLERVLATEGDGPPSPQHPRPATELPSLSGRRLRTLGERYWRWVVAVSEPADRSGDFLVEVCDPLDYHRAAYGCATATRAVPAHTLWTY